jgi:hypothetical protein
VQDQANAECGGTSGHKCLSCNLVFEMTDFVVWDLLPEFSKGFSTFSVLTNCINKRAAYFFVMDT